MEKRCEICNGSGLSATGRDAPCRYCKGTGERKESKRRPKTLVVPSTKFVGVMSLPGRK